MLSPLNDEERLDWMQLIRTPNIGPVTFFNLVRKFGSAGEALKTLPEFSQKAGRKKPLIPSNRDDARQEIKKAWNLGIQILAACEPDYPVHLRAIPSAPPLIYARGHISLFERKAVAIIGARNASGLGQKLTRNLAKDLGAQNITIVSGLARGIDTAAHIASLDTGTIAVVAGGVDHVYPPENEELMRQIADRGLILSERHLGAIPTSRDFPRRNRLISGLSAGVVIVEAAIKSGTLITANYANEQGREVFAVPGSPLDPRSQGANRLIRDGATLVESAEDIIQVLATQNRSLFEAGNEDDPDHSEFGQAPMPQKLEAEELAPADRHHLEKMILQLLGYNPLHRDEIIRETPEHPGRVADILLDLVLSDRITESDPGYFCLNDAD